VSKALIVGASRGIGLEFVRQYRAEGWEVTATARSPDGLRQLTSLGARALELDVMDPQAPARLSGPLKDTSWDVALYVAGVMSRGGASAALPREEFDRIMHANVFGAMQLIPIIAPGVAAAAGKFGFLSSALGSIAGTESSSTWLYRVSKAALNMAVKAALWEYRDALFLVLSPGWVRTDMGGPGAPVALDQSVSGLRKVIAGAGRADAGSFIDYEGRRIPW
jgi:NAD(P)-dependent dehydrogenase (short-subunit alcohol dehydrogenase family)